MQFSVEIHNIQHIDSLRFSIDLSKNQLVGIVGRNGIGKTSLMKSLLNLRSADTFKKTSSDSIFRGNSSIDYKIDDLQIGFTYDPALASLNLKGVVPEPIRAIVDVELPMPFGQRFNFFQSISDADAEIRRAIVLGEYGRPDELINFLQSIYGPDKFNDLVEIRVKGVSHYCILLPESRYIREDYLSSGEFFLISLYRKIQSRSKLIVVDEIDISLDAAAQVYLVNRLREFCARYSVNVLFSTHSLAIMQTLEDGELYHMRHGDNGIEVVQESYAYIKSTLFGFRGWDRYILTEDRVLMRFLEYVIQRYCGDIFYEYKIIYVGAAQSVVDLMLRNAHDEFFASREKVLTVLDGDQRNERYAQKDNVIFIPFESVEKKLHNDYAAGQLRLLGTYETVDPKKLFEKFISMKKLSETKIFEHLCSTNEQSVSDFARSLTAFLSRE